MDETEELKQEAKHWEVKIDETEEAIAKMVTEKNELEKTKEKLVQDLQRLNRNLDAKTNERNLLQEFINKMEGDRKSTRLNSSHVAISYAVFCLKKKKKTMLVKKYDI